MALRRHCVGGASAPRGRCVGTAWAVRGKLRGKLRGKQRGAAAARPARTHRCTTSDESAKCPSLMWSVSSTASWSSAADLNSRSTCAPQRTGHKTAAVRARPKCVCVCAGVCVCVCACVCMCVRARVCVMGVVLQPKAKAAGGRTRVLVGTGRRGLLRPPGGCGPPARPAHAKQTTLVIKAPQPQPSSAALLRRTGTAGGARPAASRCTHTDARAVAAGALGAGPPRRIGEHCSARDEAALATVPARTQCSSSSSSSSSTSRMSQLRSSDLDGKHELPWQLRRTSACDQCRARIHAPALLTRTGRTTPARISFVKCASREQPAGIGTNEPSNTCVRHRVSAPAGECRRARDGREGRGGL